VIEQIEDVCLGICGRPISFFFKRLHRELRTGLLFDDQLDDCTRPFSDLSFDLILIDEADVSG
jgi:hypothetical protein